MSNASSEPVVEEEEEAMTHSVRSALLSFKLTPQQVADIDDNAIGEVLRNCLGDIRVMSKTKLFDGSITIFGSNRDVLSVTIRSYLSRQLVTLNAEVCGDTQSILTLNNRKMEKLRKELARALSDAKVERLPVIKRWTAVPNYYTTSDERILEYDFDSIMFESHSKYQHVKILHSPSIGNCLILDDLQNLAEADIGYTRGLMDFGKIDYTGKEILILGGGDGGLLHELLKESPKFVTMVDIDQMVMQSCKQYLRGACGDSLDTFVGRNYRVIVGDCIKYMEDCLATNRKFDYIFNDLTDIPISATDHNKAEQIYNTDVDEMWQFVTRILSLALQLLNPSGQYLNHALGVGCTSALKTYEDLLKSLSVNVEFSRHTAYVPSFMEEWVFYRVWKL